MSDQKRDSAFALHMTGELVGLVLIAFVLIIVPFLGSNTPLTLLSGMTLGISISIAFHLARSLRFEYLYALESGLGKGKSFAKHHVLRFLATMVPNTLGSLALATVEFEWDYRWLALVLGVLGHLVSMGVSYYYDTKGSIVI